MATVELGRATTGAPHQALDEFVLDALQRRRVPGVAVGLLVDGAEHSAGFGVTSVEHPLAVDADTLMQIGSISKTFTATAVMRLVEAGTLDLDSPIRTYLADFRVASAEASEKVTLRHLLRHTAGWQGDYFVDMGNGDDALARFVSDMVELPEITPLGELWSYCNSGFSVAGRTIEVVTGKPYETALTELVLRPLGMERSFFFPADAMTHRFAVGHYVGDDDVRVARPWPIPRAHNAAGGISSSVNDLLRYARFQLGDGVAPDGERLLSADSMREMHTGVVPTGSGDERTGLAWHVRTVGGTTLFGHGGGTNGQISVFQVLPERNCAMVVLTNADRGGQLTMDVTRFAREHYLGLEEPDPKPVLVSVATLAPFVGRYEATLNAVEVEVKDGGLVLQVISKGGFPTRDSPPSPNPPPPTPVVFIAQDRIMATDGPFAKALGEFVRAPDGTIQFLRWGGRLAARQS